MGQAIESWSTADVPRAERFALWREVRARNLFGVTAELERDDRDAFEGSFAITAAGPAKILEVHATPYRVRRTRADIARSPSDSICLYAQLRGGGWFEAGGRDFTVGSGGLAMSHSDMPYETRPTTEAGYHFRIVKVPLSACGGLAGWRGTDPRPARSDTGLDAMLAACLESFLREAPRMSESEAALAVETLVMLALGVRSGPGTCERGRGALQEGQRQQALRFIALNFADTSLRPATIAAALRLSERQLHVLFEPTGVSVSRHIAQRRLEAARQRIVARLDPTIAATAFACGFDSLATFYRGFRAAYAIAPRDLRHGGPPAPR